jgi:hypothetical protein
VVTARAKRGEVVWQLATEPLIRAVMHVQVSFRPRRVTQDAAVIGPP